MIRHAVPWALVVTLIFVTTVCLAHEGDTHGPPPPTSVASSERHTLSASSKQFELVIKNAQLLPGQSGALEIFVSDFETNAPVRDASVQLQLRVRGGEIWSGGATATEAEGVYRAIFTPADTGTVTVIVSVAAGGQEDQFALAGLEIVAPELAGASEGVARMEWRWWYGPVAVLLLAILVSLGSRRRRGRGRALGVVALLGLWTCGAHAHEGHNQPPTASGAVVGPGSVVYLGKESQFLLGVRTQLVTQEIVKKHHRVLGRVAPRSGGELEIAAPQTGRIYFPGGRTPVLGARVARDQVVATLVVIDSLELRTALGGVVTGVSVVNGQLVAAGQKLLRVLDPSVVWVHADIYEQDLERVEKSTVARIISPAYPNQLMEGRRVALGATLGEVQGTVEAWFEVPNPRGRLRVGLIVDVDIEQEGSEPALVVPRAAMVERDGRNVMFVHMAPELFAARAVTPIANLGERIAVRGDLEPGDRVVVSGSYQLLSATVATGTP